MNVRRLPGFLKRRALALLRSLGIYRYFTYIPKRVVSVDSLLFKKLLLKTSVPGKMIKTLPETVYEEIYWHFIYYVDAVEQQTFVMQLKNARVWGSWGAVITQEGYLLDEVSREFDSKEHTINKLFKLQSYSLINERVAVLAAAGSENYYHWMFDILPRINLLKDAGEFDNVEKFIINYEGRSFQRETLARIGIQESQIIRCNDFFKFHIKAKELILPSMPSFNGCPTEAACYFLRGLYNKEMVAQDPFLYIYLSRNYGRKITNETEVLETIAPFNFQIVNPEDLSVAKQAHLFSKAKVVVSAHGAGLANLVFCQPGTVIVDIYSPQWIVPCYWVLANKVGLVYSYLIGEPNLVNNQDRNASMTVNINDLKSLLQKLKI